ncbi:MAG TPA: hypothetical protein VJ873_11325 [bacterium]|nr:hypothetical protein [bacterium]
MSPAKPIRRRNGTPSGLVSPDPVVPADGITSYTWVWYLLSVFVPFAGILIALFLFDQENWHVRKIGRNCLLITFVLWILLPILVFMLVLLAVALAIASSVSNAISPTD